MQVLLSEPLLIALCVDHPLAWLDLVPAPDLPWSTAQDGQGVIEPRTGQRRTGRLSTSKQIVLAGRRRS